MCPVKKKGIPNRTFRQFLLVLLMATICHSTSQQPRFYNRSFSRQPVFAKNASCFATLDDSGTNFSKICSFISSSPSQLRINLKVDPLSILRGKLKVKGIRCLTIAFATLHEIEEIPFGGALATKTRPATKCGFRLGNFLSNQSSH